MLAVCGVLAACGYKGPLYLPGSPQDHHRPAPPPALLEQLADGGRMVVPVAAADEDEMLTALWRRGSEFESIAIAPCRFVPLIGAEGF